MKKTSKYLVDRDCFRGSENFCRTSLSDLFLFNSFIFALQEGNLPFDCHIELDHDTEIVSVKVRGKVVLLVDK